MALVDAVPFAVAHWTLDEASGTRSDSVGSSDLTDNNTVNVDTGVIGNAADFTAANQEYLSVADNADVSSGDILFMIRFLVRFKTLSGVQAIVGKWTNSLDYLVYANGTSIVFTCNDGVPAPTITSLSTDTWYLVHVWHDPVANQIGISVNAGTPATHSISVGIQDSTDEFRVGLAVTANAQYLNGYVDDLVILKGYILDSTERTEDYNSGSPVAFADWDAVGGAALFPILSGIFPGRMI